MGCDEGRTAALAGGAAEAEKSKRSPRPEEDELVGAGAAASFGAAEVAKDADGSKLLLEDIL